MPTQSVTKSGEADDAAWAAGRGAVIGAAQWGVGTAILSALAYRFWPVYRGTTIQFKVYIQMSGMVLGSMIEADSRLRKFEYEMRMQRRWQMEKAKWERYEKEFGGKDEE